MPGNGRAWRDMLSGLQRKRTDLTGYGPRTKTGKSADALTNPQRSELADLDRRIGLVQINVDLCEAEEANG